MDNSQEKKPRVTDDMARMAGHRYVMLTTTAIPRLERSFAASGMLEPSVAAASQVVIEAAERFQKPVDPVATEPSADSVKSDGSIDPERPLNIAEIRRAIEDARNAA